MNQPPKDGAYREQAEKIVSDAESGDYWRMTMINKVAGALQGAAFEARRAAIGECYKIANGSAGCVCDSRIRALAKMDAICGNNEKKE
jgi:hypothetical protein